MSIRLAARRGRLAVRRGWLGVRREWQVGRLDLRELPDGTLRVARIAAVLIAASAVIITARAFGVVVPGPAFEVPGAFLAGGGARAIPVLAFVVACAGMCAAAAGLAIANQGSARRLSRVAIFGIALLALAQSSQLVTAASDLERLEAVLAPYHVIPSPPASLLIRIGGWVGVASALAIDGPVPHRRRGLGGAASPGCRA